MTRSITFRPTEDDIKAIEQLKAKLFSTKDSQAIHYALSRSLAGSDVEVSPVKGIVLTEAQEEMLAKFIGTTGFTREKLIEDMFGSYYESLYQADRPTVTHEPIPSRLSPEKRKALEDLKKITGNGGPEIVPQVFRGGADATPIRPVESTYDPMEPNPLGNGVFDIKTGRTITDPEELEALQFRQD